jgi:DNA-binding transcriptional MerR regulator
MTETLVEQSFDVDDIRRIREKADLRYQGMTPGEIAQAIHELAQVSHRIMESVREEKKRAIRK